MDYNIKDSSLHQNISAYAEYDRKDTAIRVGIVREERELSDGSTRYIVEVFVGGNQVGVSCSLMTRFNGTYNFEEYRLKPWLKSSTGGQQLASTASTYDLRDGDTVVVAFLDGKAREGIILGGIKHPSRDSQTTLGELSYISTYNGIETKVDAEGAYTVTFNGAPLNDSTPTVPGTVSDTAPAQYNPAIAGSFWKIDSTGGIEISDAQTVAGALNSIKITKDPASPTTVITSGRNVITLAGNPAVGEFNITTDTFTHDALSTTFKTTKDFNIDTLQMKLKGSKVAIGNDTVELIDAIITIIETIGKVVITSPVGTCTPLISDSSSGWASKIIPLLIKLKALKGSL